VEQFEDDDDNDNDSDDVEDVSVHGSWITRRYPGGEQYSCRFVQDQLRTLADSKSAHFKATRRRLPVSTVLFYRRADDFREQRLDDQTGVWVMRRYRDKRTTLAANEFLPVRLVKCDCSA
jgi:hypothetical protein